MSPASQTAHPSSIPYNFGHTQVFDWHPLATWMWSRLHHFYEAHSPYLFFGEHAGLWGLMISHLYHEPVLSFWHVHKEWVAIQHNSVVGWQVLFQHSQQYNKPEVAHYISWWGETHFDGIYDKTSGWLWPSKYRPFLWEIKWEPSHCSQQHAVLNEMPWPTQRWMWGNNSTSIYFFTPRGISSQTVRYWITDGSLTSLFHAAPSPLYLLHSQVHSISVTSLIPLHSSLFLLFHPSSLYPCFIDICPHVTMILLSFAYSLLTPFLFSLFTLVPLFLVPDRVKPTLQRRTS